VSPHDQGPGGDDEGAAFVRPYALVRGRTRAQDVPDLPVESIVETVRGALARHLPLEQGAIVERCTEPCSVAELAVHLHLPVGVCRVLVDDLLKAGAVHVHLPAGGRQADGRVDRVLLERVLAGLEAL
jgi:hypothetical protein